MIKPIEHLIFVSDIHAGSVQAILPPDFETIEAQPVGQSAVQEWYWDCWVKANNWINKHTGNDPYALVLNGDLTEGNHHGTKEIWSPEVGDHSKAAIEILSATASRATKTFVVRGTECHTGSHEIGVARALGAEVNPEFRQPFWDRLTLDIKGVRVSVRHHFPATSRVHLEASQHSIQLNNAILEAHRAKERPPQIIVGAHRHRPGHWSDGVHMSLVTGAFQGLTRHGFKVVPDGRPSPRVYRLDWRGKAHGDLPEIDYINFSAPESGVVAI